MSPSSSNVGEHLSQADTELVPAWKQELNERLAATRSRRLRIQSEQVALTGLEQSELKIREQSELKIKERSEQKIREQGEQNSKVQSEQKVESRASRLAAKVAERYANVPSYSEVLAAEARARAMAAIAAPAVQREGHGRSHGAPPTVREAEGWKTPLSAAALHCDANQQSAPAADTEENSECLTSAFALTAEPAEELVSPAVEPLAVNLIEFPRELVAARRLRPRLAEGPLRETSEDSEQDQSHLTSLQATESISPTVRVGATPAIWTPIRLDADPVSLLASHEEGRVEQIPIKTASLEDRIMAAVFDLALVVAAFAVFVLVFVACTAHPPTGKPAVIGAGLVLGGFWLLYQYLFFKFAEGTPGMHYAKIALCTFEDENPTRKAMCRRAWFLVLSAAPLGLGFIWACFDQDRLGWHDRMSRIYQRSYS